MIAVTSAQLDLWIASFIYPLTRILALAASAPLWSNAAMPRRTRLILGLAIAIGLSPALPPMPAVPPGSIAGLWIIAQQMMIGIGMGFAARIVYAAVDLAAQFISFQMGLGFATFYDPLSAANTPVLAEFFNLLALLVFLSLDGHLIYIATLAQSFVIIPVSGTPFSVNSWRNLAELGGQLFASGLLLSLPVTIALIITNIAMGVLTRAAPQLNLFALGFPLTLMGGFIVIALILNDLAMPIQAIFEAGLSAMQAFPLLSR